MKKIFKIFGFLLLLTCFSAITVAAATQKHTQKNYTGGSLSIYNTTVYTLKNVSITLNQNEPSLLESIPSSATMTVELPENDFITSVSISGKTEEGKVFSNTFHGLFTNTSCFIIYLDDYMNLRISSNTPD